MRSKTRADRLKQEIRTILIVVSAVLAALVVHHLAVQPQALAGPITLPQLSVIDDTALGSN